MLLQVRDLVVLPTPHAAPTPAQRLQTRLLLQNRLGPRLQLRQRVLRLRQLAGGAEEPRAQLGQLGVALLRRLLQREVLRLQRAQIALQRRHLRLVRQRVRVALLTQLRHRTLKRVALRLLAVRGNGSTHDHVALLVGGLELDGVVGGLALVLADLALQLQLVLGGLGVMNDPGGNGIDLCHQFRDLRAQHVVLLLAGITQVLCKQGILAQLLYLQPQLCNHVSRP